MTESQSRATPRGQWTGGFAGFIGFGRSLRARLVLLVLLASAPLLAITLYNAAELRRGEIEDARIELQGLSHLAEGRLRQAVEGSEHLLRTLAQIPAIAAGDPAECARVFAPLLGHRYTNFVVIDALGETLCDGANPNSRLNLSGRAHFKQAQATKSFVVGYPTIGLSSGRAAMALAYPLLDAAGNFRGAILSGLNLQWFGELFANTTVYPNLTFGVWTADGTVLYRHPDPEKWINKRLPETEITRAVLARRSDTMTVEAADLLGVKTLYVLTGIERWAGNRVTLSVGIPTAELFARSDRSFVQTLTSFGGVLILAVITALILAEFGIRRRISAVVAASERLAAGELAARSGLAHNGDELGVLGRSFDAMAGAMQCQVEALRRREDEIRTLNTNLERRVAERTARLEVANEELETFSYSVAHDLRAPLRAVSGYVRMLTEDHSDKLDPEMRRKLDVIQDGTTRMGVLIDDLLKLARLGRRAFRPQQIDLGRLVQECLENLRRGEPGREIEIVLSSLPACQGDPALLRQVFENLLGNAFKYTRKSGEARIEIGSEKGSGEHVFFVRDNGAGFDMQHVHKLFEVFQRLHTRAEFEGSGVGLAIVRRAIEKHGGRVWAEGAPGKGATFYFALPAGLIE